MAQILQESMSHFLMKGGNQMATKKNKVWGVKIYTRTVMEDGRSVMYGTIEAPINKMMKAYPEDFAFMRHETKRSMRAKKIRN